MKPLKEDIIQQQIIGFMSFMSKKHNFIFFAPMSEGVMMVLKKFRIPDNKIYRIMAWMSKMGFLPGVSDLIIMQDGKVFCMELKTLTGTQLKSQILFQKNCIKCGIPYEIARSLEQAQSLLHMWGIIA